VFLAAYPSSKTVMENWERYAKKVFASELGRDHTPTNLNDDDDQDVPALEGGSVGARFKIMFELDGLLVFLDLDLDKMPKLLI
jgi:hypothetical protein